MKKTLFILFIFFTIIPAPDRRPSYPFITGDGFRSLAQHVLDEELTFDPALIHEKDIIFVGTHFLPTFFSNYFPQINSSFILITHNSDYPVSTDFNSYINDKKIIKWFAQNVDELRHPKLIPIPIGLENRYCPGGKQIDQLETFILENRTNKDRPIFVYANFNPNTHDERTEVHQILSPRPYIVWSSRKNFFPYLKDLSRSIFALSPRGNGLDCLRTWEALLFGAFPIVKTSPLDSLYQDLPVVILKDWSELTRELLEQKLEEFKNCTFNMNKIYFDYWKNLILNTKESE